MAQSWQSSPWDWLLVVRSDLLVVGSGLLLVGSGLFWSWLGACVAWSALLCRMVGFIMEVAWCMFCMVRFTFGVVLLVIDIF